MKAAFELGKLRDTSAVRPLLTHILDPRSTTNINFKGMTVCYTRLAALRKISGVNPPDQLDMFSVDTSAVYFYLNWALDNAFINSKDDVDIHFQ